LMPMQQKGQLPTHLYFFGVSLLSWLNMHNVLISLRAL
jgi:hypothetical protein